MAAGSTPGTFTHENVDDPPRGPAVAASTASRTASGSRASASNHRVAELRALRAPRQTGVGLDPARPRCRSAPTRRRASAQHSSPDFPPAPSTTTRSPGGDDAARPAARRPPRRAPRAPAARAYRSGILRHAAPSKKTIAVAFDVELRALAAHRAYPGRA